VTGRIAFVPPRFGPQVVGGSESVTREAAVGLAARDWDVEVLTTRVVDHYTWANDLPEGVFLEDGVTVRRFSTVPHASRRGLRAQRSIQEGVIPPVDEQWTWVSWRFSVPDLFHHLLRYGVGYDAVVFAPYLFWTTTACLPAVATKSVVMPCLHDEAYARLDVVRPVLADAASVWFLSEPEHALAHRLGPVARRHAVTGAGVDIPSGYDPDGFRARHGLRRPFILYAGRREKDKGWDWLMDVFATAIAGPGLDDLDLVTIGVGEVRPPRHLSKRVIDLGFLSDSERNNAFASALAYVQPSRMESFSRTIMEAWLAGTPVLTIDNSDVVRWHCQQSGGGLAFGDGTELGRHLRRLHDQPDEAAAMAARGRHYVMGNYTWPVVLDRMESDLLDLISTGSR
jgi:glycosyltransferase involved in cell wall biosynthesis